MSTRVNLRLFLERWATGRVILVLLGLFLLFTVVIFPLLTSQLTQLSNGVSLIDNEFSYTPENAYQMLTSYGPQGRPLYIGQRPRGTMRMSPCHSPTAWHRTRTPVPV